MNEFSPTWRESSMSVDVVEGRVYDYIRRVEAVDRDGHTDDSDGGGGGGDICRYHLLTDDVPFSIDSDGQ